MYYPDEEKETSAERLGQVTASHSLVGLVLLDAQDEPLVRAGLQGRGDEARRAADDRAS